MDVLFASIKTIAVCAIGIMVTGAVIVTGGGLIIALIGIAAYRIARDA